MAKEKFICDGCGKEVISEKFPAHDENYNPEPGMFYCADCNFTSEDDAHYHEKNVDLKGGWFDEEED